LSNLSKDAGDVDDAAPALLQHGADHRLDEQERASQVGVEDFVPVGALHAHDQLIAGDAGIVDQDVDLAELREGGLHFGLDLLFVADVHLERGSFPALTLDLAGELLQLFMIARAQRDLGPGFGQHQRTRTTYPLRRPSYQRNSALDSWHETSC